MPGTTGQPRTALFTQVPVNWSDGTAFNGFYLVGLVPASDGVTAWSETDFGNVFPGLRLPIWQVIPITAGVINQVCGLYFNSDINPPGTKYIAYLYDTTGRQLAGPNSAFTVSASPVTISGLTATIPSTTGTAPTPDTTLQPFN